MKKTRKKKPYVVRKYDIGLTILGGLRAPCQFCMNYEVRWSDGSMTIEQGKFLRTVPFSQDLNGTKAEKKEAGETLRPDLHTALGAASILFQDLSYACLHADGQLRKLR